MTSAPKSLAIRSAKPTANVVSVPSGAWGPWYSTLPRGSATLVHAVDAGGIEQVARKRFEELAHQEHPEGRDQPGKAMPQ